MAQIVAPAPYVRIWLAAQLTGYTEKAIRRKISEGVWREGKEYRKAPDGAVLISMAGYAKWAEFGDGW
ncbi:MAG: excisionase [Rubrivivax sp.]